MRKTIFTLFLAIVASMGTMKATVYSGTCGENLTWSLNDQDSTLSISGTGAMFNYGSSGPWYNYRSCIAYVSIAKSVTTIGNYAFNECTKLRIVKLRNGITYIGNNAFNSCYNLREITLPESVSTIGEYAFANCIYMKSVTFGTNLKSIKHAAFSNCTQLTAVYISDIASWCNITFGSYVANPLLNAKHLYLDNTEIENLLIPEGITKLNAYAFYDCSSFTSVSLPSSLTEIGELAFNDCTISKLTVFATTPPEGGSESGIAARSCELYVPEAAIETYEDSEWWDFFKEIKPINNLFTVQFVDWDGREISSQSIKSGEAAVAPEYPTRDGYNFIGWDTDFSNVTENLVVTAQYEEIIIPVFTVRYKDKDGALLDSEEIELHLPEAPEVVGFSLLYWQTETGNIADGITIQAVYQSDSPTAAPEVTNPANPAQKLVRQGNVYILRDSKTYTLTGQEVK